METPEPERKKTSYRNFWLPKKFIKVKMTARVEILWRIFEEIAKNLAFPVL